MNNLMDILTKSGYEVSSVGNDVFPCALSKDNVPVGFLMPDFSLSLVSNHEAERDSLNKAISFALDSQDLETVGGEFKLSQYQNIVLTTAYDYQAEKPIFNISSIDKDKNLTLLNSVEDKVAATQDFAARSGLVAGQIEQPAQGIDRIAQFVDRIKEKGYSLAAAVDEAHKVYEIFDRDNNVVGYIGKNNRVTITTEKVKAKRFLTDTYIDTNPNKIVLPSFFEKLKERLKEIGLALKVIFTREGQHYSINDKHVEVATINEKHEVTYTSSATSEHMEKINAMVKDIERENLERQNPKKEVLQEVEPVQQVQQKAVIEQPVAAPVIQPPVQAPAFTQEEIHNLSETILSSPKFTERFVSFVLSDATLIAQLTDTLAEKLTQINENVEIPQPAIPENKVSEQTVPLSEAEQKISAEFNQYSDLLQTVSGFNQDKEKAAIQEMTEKFGTTDRKEFERKLQHGDYAEPKTLADKIKVSKQKADIQNDRKAQEKVQEPSKEQSKKQVKE